MLRSSISSADEVFRKFAPNDNPGDHLLGVLSQDDQLVGALNQGQIGAMGASDTVNDIAALAALSDLDQDERIERVGETISCGCVVVLSLCFVHRSLARLETCKSV